MLGGFFSSCLRFIRPSCFIRREGALFPAVLCSGKVTFFVEFDATPALSFFFDMPRWILLASVFNTEVALAPCRFSGMHTVICESTFSGAGSLLYRFSVPMSAYFAAEHLIVPFDSTFYPKTEVVVPSP